jgi:hypothetical protein
MSKEEIQQMKEILEDCWFTAIGWYQNKKRDFRGSKWAFEDFIKKHFEELEQQLHCKDDLVTGAGNSISDIGDAPFISNNSIEQ